MSGVGQEAAIVGFVPRSRGNITFRTLRHFLSSLVVALVAMSPEAAWGDEQCVDVDPDNLQLSGGWIHDITYDHDYHAESNEKAKKLVSIFKSYNIRQYCRILNPGGPTHATTIMSYMLDGSGKIPNVNLNADIKCYKFERPKLFVEWQTWGPYKNTYFLKDGKNAPVRRGGQGNLEYIKNRIIQLGANWRCTDPQDLYESFRIDANWAPDTIMVIEYWTGAPLDATAGRWNRVPQPATQTTPRFPDGRDPGRRAPEAHPDMPVQPGEPVVPSFDTSTTGRERDLLCEVGGETLIDSTDLTNGYRHYKGRLWFRSLSKLRGVSIRFKGDYLCSCVNCPWGSSHALGLKPDGEFEANEIREYDVDCVRDRGSVPVLKKGRGEIDYFVLTAPPAGGNFRTQRCQGEFLIKSHP